MDEIIKKVSEYDLLNILMPGAVLVSCLKPLGYLDADAVGILQYVVLSYAVGLVASRVGSLVLEEIARCTGLIVRDYEDFVRAQRSDDRVLLLATISNMYRTVAGALVVLGVLALGTLVPEDSRGLLYLVYGVVCFALFFRAWIKQEGYIEKRVNMYGGANDVDY